jgi:hypothetical protein
MYQMHSNGVFVIGQSEVDQFCKFYNVILSNGTPNGAGCSRWDMLDDDYNCVDQVDIYVQSEEHTTTIIKPDYLSYAEQARHREKSGFGM